MPHATQLWAHRRSGETYALIADRDRGVIEAAGPLSAEDRAWIVLGHAWDGDPDVTADLADASDDYALWEVGPERRDEAMITLLRAYPSTTTLLLYGEDGCLDEGLDSPEPAAADVAGYADHGLLVALAADGVPYRQAAYSHLHGVNRDLIDAVHAYLREAGEAQ